MDLPGFLFANRDDLIARCRSRVASRGLEGLPTLELEHGISPFLDQLITALQSEPGEDADGVAIAPVPGGRADLTEMGATAAAHGRELLAHGYDVEALVHVYGDLCQAITDMAVERGAKIGAREFRILNRCLDNATATAVTEFGYQRDAMVAERNADSINERLGIFAHELRNSLSTASLAVQLIRAGNVGHTGATAAVLDRSLVQMRQLIDRSLAEVRLNAGLPSRDLLFSLGDFIAETRVTAQLEATTRECILHVARVDSALAVEADRELLFAAVGNLLQNAFKYTQRGTEVSLRAYASGDRIFIEVADHCGGLPNGDAEKLFAPFVQSSADRSGIGLGLSIARRGVEANHGSLRVRDLPGHGCVFTIELPRRAMPEVTAHSDAGTAAA